MDPNSQTENPSVVQPSAEPSSQNNSPSQPAGAQSHQDNTSTVVTILLLLLAPLIGVIVMWFWPKWSKKIKWIITAVYILLSVLAIALVIWTVMPLMDAKSQVEQIDTDIANQQTVPQVNVNCEALYLEPKLQQENEIEPMFMRESASIAGKGYEGIVRRSLSDNYVSYDVVTNALPDENSPYNLFVLNVDNTGKVCDQNLIGKLEKIPELGSWTIADFGHNLEDGNDGVVIAITEKGFGDQPNDIFNNLDHPSIILLGTYMSNNGQ